MLACKGCVFLVLLKAEGRSDEISKSLIVMLQAQLSTCLTRSMIYSPGSGGFGAVYACDRID